MDGANMNALMGVARPGDMGVDVMQFNLHKTFSTPHGGGGPGAGPVAVRASLRPYLPVPRLVRSEAGYRWDEAPGKSVGRVRSFYGNFGILLRALAYMLRLGGPGLRDVTRYAVLNANYLRARLAGAYHLAYDTPSLHECVFNDRRQQETGVQTMDIAKRLLDYGFYAPTIYFPLVVKGALMIEPTETESRETLDEFVAAMLAIAAEAREQPDLVRGAPHTTRVGRLDETRAARRPVLRWRPAQAPSRTGEN
jgi:glycine dehydrogenase subunit 2